MMVAARGGSSIALLRLAAVVVCSLACVTKVACAGNQGTAGSRGGRGRGRAEGECMASGNGKHVMFALNQADGSIGIKGLQSFQDSRPYAVEQKVRSVAA